MRGFMDGFVDGAMDWMGRRGDAKGEVERDIDVERM